MSENRKIKLTKKILTDSLIELLNDNDITNISVTMLCTHSDINRTTFYKYYKKPLDVLNELEDHILSSSLLKLSSLKSISNIEETIKVIDSIIAFNMSELKYFSFLMSEHSGLSYQKKLIPLIYNAAKNFISPLLINKDEDKLIYILHGSLALIQKWLKLETIPSSRYMATNIVKLALKILE